MYDELIRSIHCCFGFDSMQTDCENCMMKDKREEHNYVGCCDALGLAAADAIEQLTADLERSKEWEGFWEEQAEEAKGKLQQYALAVANKPRWIPVTERLPYKSGYYLIVTHLGLPDDAEDWMKDNAVDVTMAHYADYSNIWTTDSGAAYNADLSKCDKTRYEYVTHWMPLPEPPRED